MKRILLILGILLFSNTLKAQSVEYTCRYWFDQNHAEAVVTNFGVDGWEAELDVGALTDGLHSLHIHVMDTSMIWTAPQSFMFMRMPVEEQIANLYYHCWFDQDCENVQTGLVGNGIFELEVGDLSNGIHTVNVQLDNGAMTAPQSYLFYKQPLGGYGVARWEYWLNGDMQNKYVTNISPAVDTLDIISLLSVGHPELRSSCFHFHPNGDEPYINAKNEITFRFWDAEMRFFDKSEFFVDEQVQQDINAQVFERNTTETFAAPRDNQIQWFKIEAGIGDSLAFKADKACTMQLFAPSGEKVYAVSASEAMVFDGCHAWEDGTYYLAVHDMTGSGDEMSVTYEWAYRYAILAYDAHQVGNGGCSTINFQGNGFNSLLDAYLVNAQNDTIHNLDIGHESNSVTTITFNFYNEPLGIYDAVFEFWEESIRINGALEVEEPVDIVLTSTVSYPSTFLTNTECTYTYTITNEGNMSAYYMPLYVYIGTNTFDGISHLTISGLKLKKIHEYIDNFDDYTEQEQQDLRQLSDLIGDDHYFAPYINADTSGDSIAIRAGYFVIDLAPYETKTISFSITSSQIIELWLSLPNEWNPIYAFSNDRMFYSEDIYSDGHRNQISDRSNFCCWHDGFEAGLSAFSGVAGTVAMIGFFMPDLLTTAGAGIAEIASLSSGLLGTLSGIAAAIWCQDNPPQDWLSQNKGNLASFLGNTLNAATKLFRKARVIGAVSAVGGPILDFYGMSNSLASREKAHKSSLCTDDPPKGGESTPVASMDPNDIHGYLSESGSHYIRQEIQNINYEIEFENDTTLATAAAHTIIVRDTLDATKFALNSLAAHSVTIGDKRLELNGEQTFARTLDMRPELYVIAQIEQDYDPATGIIQWTISSLDPMTMEPTDNPFQGVLPVNYFGEGVGFIDYSVNLKQMFADGTEISNRAGIIFDGEDLIMTPTWTNIVDAVKPTSTIADVTQVADTLNFIFSSEDNRSGIWYHTLYFRNESTEMEWKVKKSQILENNYKMNLEDLQMTEYFVLATDSAGNREDKDFLAEYIYSQDNVTLQNNTLVQGWNWWSTYVEQSTMDGLTTVENSLGNNGLTIKSQNEFTTNYYENMGYDYWYGGLEAIDNEHGYMINTNTACNVRMLGTPAQPEDHPITIGANWNWIGYPVGQQQLLATSISGTFQPESEDVMKNHSGFATYYPGYGWYPDDFIMTPGEGYLYKSNSTANKTLTYVLSRKHSYASKQKEIHQWQPEIHKYVDNISVIAVLDMNGYEIRENIEVGAFVNGECRGSAILRYFEPTDRYYAMLSIAGEDDDVVSFEIQGSNSETHITFHKNDVIGSLDAPLPIEFGFLGNDVSDLTLYPNPVERDANFSIDIPTWEKVSDVTITNVLGLVIRKESTNEINMNGIHEPGIYIVKITCKTGNVYQNVLIVK